MYEKNLYHHDIIKAAIDAHQILIHNTSLYKNNIYYIPPEVFFQKNSKKELDYRLENLEKNNIAVQALEESEKKFRTIFNHAHDAFYIFRLKKDLSPERFIEINNEASRMLGYTREEFLGMTYLDIKPVNWKTPFPILHTLISQGHATFETEHTAKNGSVIPVEIHAFICPFNGSPAIISVARNITERKQSDLREKKLLEQLRQLQKMEALGTLTGGIAHDFNNILSIMLGYTELSQIKIPPENPAQASLKHVREACFRAKNIVHQLLTFARRGENTKKELDVRIVIKEELKMLRSTLPSSIEFQIDMPTGNFPNIRGNLTEIHQLFVNLCTNASHAMMKDGGIMTVRLTNVRCDHPEEFEPDLVPGEFLLLSVQDTGLGILPTQIDRIFDPYFTTKDKTKGSGLGLSVVRGIVKTHKGGIRVSSTPGQGTTFDIFLPVISSHTPQQTPLHMPEPSRGNERLLFVDDEECLTLLGRERLECLGYMVQTTTDPYQALRWFQKNPSLFDLVITDMTMPGMTGIKLSQRLHAVRKDIPIILCSGFNEVLSKTACKDSGITLYLDKPVDLNKLAYSIRDLLDK